jgi:transcriptional regulator with XRE-family HTH domain
VDSELNDADFSFSLLPMLKQHAYMSIISHKSEYLSSSVNINYRQNKKNTDFLVNYIDIFWVVYENGPMMIEKNDLYRVIGKQIKAKRQENSLKQENLAAEIKLTRSSIAQIEAGKQAPSIFLLYQLCDVLKISVFDILPKDEFDLLSSERLLEKAQIREILEKAKKEGKEYEPTEYSDNSK